MDYTVSANWTAFKGDWADREVVRTGTISFPMSDRVDIAGAANIAALNVAKAYDLNYRDVCATVTAVTAVTAMTAAPRQAVEATATVVEAAQIRQQEAMLRYAGITFASSLVAFFVIMLLIKWVGRSSEKKQTEDFSLAITALRTRTDELERQVDKVSDRQAIMREQCAATHSTMQG